MKKNRIKKLIVVIDFITAIVKLGIAVLAFFYFV